MKKTSKKVKKAKTPLAAKAMAQLQTELAPIFKACNALSKKYAALAAAETKKEKAAEKRASKSSTMNDAAHELMYAHGDLARTYADLADDLQYVPMRPKTKFAVVPRLENIVDMDDDDFYCLDDLAKLLSIAKPTAAKRPTGGAPLSNATKNKKESK